MRHLDFYRAPRNLSGNSLWNMLGEFDDVFGRTFRNGGLQTLDNDELFEPRVDIEETQDQYLLKFDLPGVKKEDLKIDVVGRTLSLSGERKQEKESKENGFSRYECATGRFTRSFTLPQSVDIAKVEANLTDGVLRVAIPKSEAEKPRAIEVK